MDDYNNYEDFANDYNNRINILKTNSSVLKQTGMSLVKAGECIDEMVNIYTNPVSLIMPGATDHINELQKKANGYIYIANSNLTQLSKILDDIVNDKDKNKDENNDGV